MTGSSHSYGSYDYEDPDGLEFDSKLDFDETKHKPPPVSKLKAKTSNSHRTVNSLKLKSPRPPRPRSRLRLKARPKQEGGSPKKGGGCGCLAYLVIITIVLSVLGAGAYLAYCWYNTDKAYQGSFGRAHMDSDSANADRNYGPSKGYGHEAPGRDIAKHENNFTKAEANKESWGKRARRNTWKAVKWCTFPAWCVPYLLCKSSKFRNAAFMTIGLSWLTGSFSSMTGGAMDTGSFFYAGLPGILAITGLAWYANNYVFTTKPF